MTSEQDKDYQKWLKVFQSGKDHSEPSPKTMEELAVIKTNYNNLMEQNSKEHAEIKETLKEIKDYLEKSLDKKADKSEVEIAKEDIKSIKGDIRWVVYTIIGTLIAGIVSFIYFK